jgi:GTPase SAR1 family protein
VNLKIITILYLVISKILKIKIIFFLKFFNLINFSTKGKILFIGALGTGKTSLIQASKGICADPKVFLNTIGIEFISFEMSVGNRKVKMDQ